MGADSPEFELPPTQASAGDPINGHAAATTNGADVFEIAPAPSRRSANNATQWGRASMDGRPDVSSTVLHDPTAMEEEIIIGGERVIEQGAC